MKRNIHFGTVGAIIAIAIGVSISVFGDVTTPVKLTMFGLGTIAGIMIGRIATLRAIEAQS